MNKNLYKHRAIIQSQNIITAKQRKSFNALMSIAKPQLQQDKSQYKFTTTLNEIKELISKKRINNSELKQSLEELMDLKLEFNIMEDGRWKSWNKMVLVSWIQIDENENITFEFPSPIRENIIDPEIYGVIDMKVNKALEHKHSIPIYEFCKDYINSEIPRLELEVFKKLLGIEGKYKEPRHLRIKVLNPATKEINEKSDIEIRWEFSYTGKKITHINFWSKKKSKQSTENTDIQQPTLFSEDRFTKAIDKVMRNVNISRKFKRQDIFIFINSIKSRYPEDKIIEVMDRIYKFNKEIKTSKFENLFNGFMKNIE